MGSNSQGAAAGAVEAAAGAVWEAAGAMKETAAGIHCGGSGFRDYTA